MNRQSTPRRSVFSASAVLEAIATDLTAIKDADGLTDADLGAILGKSGDQAAKYRTGLAEMRIVAFARAKREWHGRFTGSLDRLCGDERHAGLDDAMCQSAIIRAGLVLAMAMERGRLITPEQVRDNRAALEAALDAIQAQLAKLTLTGVA
jgi:hypothetical protein